MNHLHPPVTEFSLKPTFMDGILVKPDRGARCAEAALEGRLFWSLREARSAGGWAQGVTLYVVMESQGRDSDVRWKCFSSRKHLSEWIMAVNDGLCIECGESAGKKAQRGYCEECWALYLRLQDALHTLRAIRVRDARKRRLRDELERVAGEIEGRRDLISEASAAEKAAVLDAILAKYDEGEDAEEGR